MTSLNDKIQAYLITNNIPQPPGAYTTGQPEGEEDQILYWDESALGPTPTEAQLDAAWVEYSGQLSKQQNKTQAETLLQQTDWVELSDVSDPANPPWLTNKAEFTSYRAALRAIAINPPITVDPWPTKPEEIWSTEAE